MSETTELLEMAVGQLWQITILCVVAGWISNRLLRQHPEWSYLLWLAVLLKAVTPPVWSSHCGVFSWFFHHLSTTTTHAMERCCGPVDPQQMAEVVFGIWLAGAALWLTATMLHWSRTRRRILAQATEPPRSLTSKVRRLTTQLGIHREVRVILTAAPIGPAIVGCWRPLLVLPTEIVTDRSLRELEPVIVHELLHVRRGDTWVAALETLVRAAWWFHPLVHRAADAATRAGELCCDQDVLSVLTCKPRHYADSLLQVIEAKCALQPVVACPGIRPVDVTRDRLTRIMTSSQSKPGRWLRLGLLLLVLFVLLPGRPVVYDEQPVPTTVQLVSQ